MVFRTGAVWYYNRRLLVGLSFPFVLGEPLIGCNGGTTCIIVVVLPLAIKLTKYTIFSNSDVWCEENDQVSSGGDVPSKSPKAYLSSERNASKSAQVEGSIC